MLQTPGDRAFSVLDAAERLGGISRAEIYNEIRRGKLSARKIGRRTVILQSAIDAYLAALPAAGPD